MKRKYLLHKHFYYILLLFSGFFQVYDQIIGIVNYENIHIFGITCALAWQLPHSPIKPIKSSKPLHNENITVMANVNETANATSNGTATKRIDLLHFNTYYDRQHYHEQQYNGNDLYYPLRQTPKTNGIPLNSRWNATTGKNTAATPTNEDQSQRWQYKHRIYPALRMRRHIDTHDGYVNDANIHPDVEVQLNHHRNTRFDLYKSIEKYLDG